MAPQTTRERTIAFYEIVRSASGEHERVPPLPIAEALGDLSRAPLERRRHDGDRTIVGTVKALDDEDHLLLHRVRDRGEWLSRMNLATGEWQELESAAEEGYLDTSALFFVPYGNVVALMLGSTSAPTHKSLEGWLNHLRLFGDDASLVVRPLLTHAEIERLQRADGASRIEIRVGSSKRGALAEKEGRLARFLTRAYDDYGDVDVTVTIAIPRGGAREQDRRRLLEDLQDIEDVVPGSERAKARLVFSSPGSEDHTRLTELVEHHITAKRKVPAVDEEGNSIRLEAALRVMQTVAAEHDEELRLASEADS